MKHNLHKKKQFVEHITAVYVLTLQITQKKKLLIGSRLLFDVCSKIMIIVFYLKTLKTYKNQFTNIGITLVLFLFVQIVNFCECFQKRMGCFNPLTPLNPFFINHFS